MRDESKVPVGDEKKKGGVRNDKTRGEKANIGIQ